MNNGGWGLRIMLALCFLLILALIIGTSILNANFKNVAPINTLNTRENYYNLEVKMVNAAKKYITDKYRNVEHLTVTIDKLIENKYITKIRDPYTYKECSGYVIFTNVNNKIEYLPYLKCADKYQTGGYNSTYEN